MSPAVVVILIFVLAIVLVAVGLGLSRRSRRGEAAPPRRAEAPPVTPPVPAPPPPAAAEPVEAQPVEAEPAEAEPVEAEPVEAAPLPGAEPLPVERVEEAAPPRLRDRLGRSRAGFAWLRGRRTIDDETWEELEDTLLLADVGVPTTTRVLDAVREHARAEHASDRDALVGVLHRELVAVLGADSRGLARTDGEPNVWMFVGVNGVGKTTTIAKVAEHEIAAGHRVVLAAADTFRAAAAEQLAHWAHRVGAGMVRGQEGADPGSVVFDAMSAAAGRDADLVLVDTAGRLHTKVNLMSELEKLRRIVERTPGALKEVLLVLDATTGQNGLTQARQFAESVEVTGVVLTKLDSTAKGGIVLAIEAELGIPVKLVGVGESAADLLPFDPETFVAALLDA